MPDATHRLRIRRLDTVGLVDKGAARSDSKFTAALFVLTGWFAKYFMRRMLNKELVDLQNALNSQQAEKVDG